MGEQNKNRTDSTNNIRLELDDAELNLFIQYEGGGQPNNNNSNLRVLDQLLLSLSDVPRVREKVRALSAARGAVSCKLYGVVILLRFLCDCFMSSSILRGLEILTAPISYVCYLSIDELIRHFL